MRSVVLYLFKCQCCSASYVGQTTRHLHNRVPEYLGISPITGKPSSSPVMSSIFSHLNFTGHSANFDDLEIPPLALAADLAVFVTDAQASAEGARFLGGMQGYAPQENFKI